MKNFFRTSAMKFSVMVTACLLTFGNIDAQTKDEKSLLWKIEGKDLTQPSYLFGTFPMICQNV